jgi:hypothetical protein
MCVFDTVWNKFQDQHCPMTSHGISTLPKLGVVPNWVVTQRTADCGTCVGEVLLWWLSC